MVGWLTFFKERVPLLSFCFSSAGIAVSASVVATGTISSPTLLTLFGLVLFFATLRVMDDIKDVGKDRIAHPKRALAAGVISIKQAKAGVQVMLGIHIAFAAILHLSLNAVAGLTFLVLTAYLWLMYREFFVGAWLQERPLLYALTHQIIIVPCTAFATATVAPDSVFTKETAALSALFFGGFFAYEVGRKFDPKAHRVLNTYRQVYGAVPSAAFMAAAMVISVIGAITLGILPYTIAVQLLCATIPFTIALGAPRAYKSVEMIATLTLAFVLWAPIVLWR